MLDNKCVFCKILRGEIPSAKVYEDDEMLVFKDIEPKAKVHLLAVPKDHFKLLADMDDARQGALAYAGENSPDCRAERLYKRLPPCNQPGRRRWPDGIPPAHSHSRRRKLALVSGVPRRNVAIGNS